MNATKRTLVWDLPTRLFHWFLAAGFCTAATIALVLGEHSALFPYHAIIGLILSLIILLRVVWGFFGSRYARFSSFAFGPRAVLEYTRGVLTGSGARHVGHNPGSAWAIFAMLALVLSLALTGILMGRGNESLEDIHEILAYVMVGVVILHVLGVVVHTIRHRDNIGASMIHGRKDVEAQDGISSSHAVVALVFSILCVASGVGLVANYDPAKQTTRLPLLGISLQVGEGQEGGQSSPRQDDDDDDDDD